MSLHEPSRHPSSESGLISVSAVIGLAIAALFVYLLLAALDGDPTHYGTVAIPSEGAPVELDEGETDIFYAEAVEGEAAGSLAPPEDLSITVVGPEGAVRIDSRGGEPEEIEGGTARVVAAAFPPAEGEYLVDVDAEELAQRAGPTLTFGQSPVGAVKARFEDVVDELSGPTGIVVVAVLVLLFLFPRIQRAIRAR